MKKHKFTLKQKKQLIHEKLKADKVEIPGGKLITQCDYWKTSYKFCNFPYNNYNTGSVVLLAKSPATLWDRAFKLIVGKDEAIK